MILFNKTDSRRMQIRKSINCSRMGNSDLEKFLPKSQSQFIYGFSFTFDDIYWVILSAVILFLTNMIIGYFAIKWIVGKFRK